MAAEGGKLSMLFPKTNLIVCFRPFTDLDDKTKRPQMP